MMTSGNPNASRYDTRPSPGYGARPSHASRNVAFDDTAHMAFLEEPPSAFECNTAFSMERREPEHADGFDPIFDDIFDRRYYDLTVDQFSACDFERSFIF